MVTVRVRETYDLQTVKGKMTVIAIHTPKPNIIKQNYPGLLMQCRCYRPKAASVRIACASVQPLDPLGIGLNEGDVAPEDVFNPILYKAISNKGMSQLEARINQNVQSGTGVDTSGHIADVDIDTAGLGVDEFAMYYGLLSNTHEWRHANPQRGLEMNNLRPLVYDVVANIGDSRGSAPNQLPKAPGYPEADGSFNYGTVQYIIGKAKEMPWLNCTSFGNDAEDSANKYLPGFQTYSVQNAEQIVPYIPIVCAVIIIPPSKLHELFFRMVCEWEIEFSSIRPLGEITDYTGLAALATGSHFQNYSYPETKKAITGDDSTILDNDTCMVSSNVDVKKVM